MNMNILDLIDQQSKIQPDASAIQDESSQLTYSELFIKSTQFAHFLIQMGIGKDSLVALSLPASKECFITILAILRTGAAYVPIDPMTPIDRKQIVLKTCNPNLLITKKNEKFLIEFFKGSIINIDQFWDLDSQKNSEHIPLRPIQSGLAYIIFTSGSTGTPKGVMIEYQALCHLSLAIQEVIPLSSSERFLQFASLGFDASIFDWVATLTQGATLCCISDKEKKYNLKNILNHYRITIADLSPSIAGLLDPKDFPFLKTLIVAGEACHEQLVQKWKDHVQLFNLYGPTEATVWSTFFIHSGKQGYPSTTIGKPIKTLSIYIVNEKNEICPQGEIGELLLEGNNLALGYFNDPALTAQFFIYLPHITTKRLYRTGDLVRVLPDLNLEFIGRKDTQIKIYGNRIELGEIENILNQHPLVELAVVQAYKKEKTNVHQLIGFYTSKNGKFKRSDKQKICKFLEEKLPPYMIPKELISFKTFPLNEQNKIDRAKLLEYFKSYKKPIPSNKKYFQYPSNELELEILKIWLKVLNKQILEKEDDFFDHGGDSILAIQLCLELEVVLKRPIDFSMPYEARTIAAQSKFLSPKSHRISRIPLTLLSDKKSSRKQKFFFIHPASGLCLTYFPLAKNLQNFTCLGINSPYIGSKKNCFPNLETMAAQYIRFIKKVQKKGPYLIGGWSLGGNVTVEIARQLILTQNEIQALILFDSFNYPAYNLSELPMRNAKELISKKNHLLTADELEILSFEFEHNERIGIHYHPPKKIDCRILLLKSNEIEESFSMLQTLPDNGWSTVIEGRFTIEKVPCKHSNMFDTQYIPILSELIKKHIE